MSNDTLDVLSDLIKTCNDGAKGFKTAADDAKREDIRQACLTGMARCRDAGAELATLMRGLGKEPPEGGSAAGALHRGWVEVRQAISGDSDLALMEECERGEDKAKASYRKALEKNIDPQVRLVIERQYQGVLENHDKIHAIRDALRDAAHA
jgi:uncharacterized protein (TIGR02284 family)